MTCSLIRKIPGGLAMWALWSRCGSWCNRQVDEIQITVTTIAEQVGDLTMGSAAIGASHSDV